MIFYIHKEEWSGLFTLKKYYVISRFLIFFWNLLFDFFQLLCDDQVPLWRILSKETDLINYT